MQFDTNSDFATLPPSNPLEFPPADALPCARITTRVYHPSRDEVSTVDNVLLKTMMPAVVRSTSVIMGGTDEANRTNDDDESSTSTSSSGSFMDDEEEDDDDGNAFSASSSGQPERAYWMQRTIREAIYGKVLYGVVLQKTPDRPEWVVTTEPCAIKEMSWQHIRRERAKLAEDPIKEVNAMQFLSKWHHQQSRSNDSANDTSTTSSVSSFRAMADTNIMMPMDLLSDDQHLYSIMPFCDGGELFERLDLNDRFTEDEARYWMFQILKGLDTLQRAGICHRDLSLENLLVHQNGCLIIDMGMCLRLPYANQNAPGGADLSNSFNNMSLGTANRSKTPRHLILPQGTCGKWIYMSPEIYRNRDPFDGYAVDMWAAGVILFLMLTGFPPWERACGTDERFKYMTAGYLVQMLTEWELGLSSDAMDLLQRMLWLDPKDRLSLEQVRAHPWMTSGRMVGPN